MFLYLQGPVLWWVPVHHMPYYVQAVVSHIVCIVVCIFPCWLVARFSKSFYNCYNSISNGMVPPFFLFTIVVNKFVKIDNREFCWAVFSLTWFDPDFVLSRLVCLTPTIGSFYGNWNLTEIVCNLNYRRWLAPDSLRIHIRSGPCN